MTSAHPILITMGDPVGIGPEIIVRAFRDGAAQGCVVVGDAAVMALDVAALDADTEVATGSEPSSPDAQIFS